MGNKKPKFMITFLCPECGMDFAVTELDESKCFYCQAVNIDFIEIKKQKLSLKVIKERLEITTNRMMNNLQQAFITGKEVDNPDADELIDVMAKAKKLHLGVKDLKLEEKK